MVPPGLWGEVIQLLQVALRPLLKELVQFLHLGSLGPFSFIDFASRLVQPRLDPLLLCFKDIV